MIDWDNKIVVVHPPRCGGTTLEASVLGYDLFFSKELWSKHRSASEIEDVLKRRNLDPKSFRWYGLKRNPVDRVISMYHTGYWDDCLECIPKKREKVSLLKFVCSIRSHPLEVPNFSLFDYHGFNRYPIYDISEVELLIRTINPNAAILTKEKSYGVKKNPGYLIRSLIFLRYWKDYAMYGYKIDLFDIINLPLALFVFICFKLYALCSCFLKTMKKYFQIYIYIKNNYKKRLL